MNSSNNLTIEEKLGQWYAISQNGYNWGRMTKGEKNDEIRFRMTQPEFKQLLSLIQEERLNELEITMDKWNDTDFDGFIKYASERSEALKQPKGGTK